MRLLKIRVIINYSENFNKNILYSYLSSEQRQKNTADTAGKLHSLLKVKTQTGDREKMAFDFKKEYKEFYMPKKKPAIIIIPAMNYIAVRGQGDPNEESGAYKRSIELLYGVAFTVKMSKKSGRQIEGYFEYVVPPLEGFWWQEGTESLDYTQKDKFRWISVIRLPDFVKKPDFDWAVAEAAKKKKDDFSKVEFMSYEEGLCVQSIHIGLYDAESATIALMHDYMTGQGYVLDISDQRLHHEIYLSDARRVAPEKRKTLIRHPIRRA